MTAVNIHEARTRHFKPIARAVQGEAVVIARASKPLAGKTAPNELLSSGVSRREIAVERTLGRADFRVEPRLLRRGLL